MDSLRNYLSKQRIQDIFVELPRKPRDFLGIPKDFLGIPKDVLGIPRDS